MAKINAEVSTESSTIAAINANNINHQAKIIADKQLTKMTNNGLLKLQPPYYIIEFQLKNGKILVNGNQFNSSMLKFE